MPEVLRHFSQVPVHGRSEHQRGVCRGNTVPGRQVQRHIAEKSLHSIHGGAHEVRVTSLTFKIVFFYLILHRDLLAHQVGLPVTLLRKFFYYSVP